MTPTVMTVIISDFPFVMNLTIEAAVLTVIVSIYHMNIILIVLNTSAMNTLISVIYTITTLQLRAIIRIVTKPLISAVYTI